MSFASTVLVYEFFTGGGVPAGPLPRGLAAEALGMLWALLTDFHSLSVRTITAFDTRFEHHVPGLCRETLPADEVASALPGAYQSVYLSLLARCDAALIIAPETNGILSELTSQAEAAGKTLLGSSSSAAALAGDKAACSRIFAQADLPSPETRTASFAAAPEVAGQMGFPLILKPVDGVGSEGVCIVEDSSDIPSVLSIVRQVTDHEQVLLQSFSGGVPVSVSLLAAKGSAIPLSLNYQMVDIGSPNLWTLRGETCPTWPGRRMEKQSP